MGSMIKITLSIFYFCFVVALEKSELSLALNEGEDTCALDLCCSSSLAMKLKDFHLLLGNGTTWSEDLYCGCRMKNENENKNCYSTFQHLQNKFNSQKVMCTDYSIVSYVRFRREKCLSLIKLKASNNKMRFQRQPVKICFSTFNFSFNLDFLVTNTSEKCINIGKREDLSPGSLYESWYKLVYSIQSSPNLDLRENVDRGSLTQSNTLPNSDSLILKRRTKMVDDQEYSAMKLVEANALQILMETLNETVISLQTTLERSFEKINTLFEGSAYKNIYKLQELLQTQNLSNKSRIGEKDEPGFNDVVSVTPLQFMPYTRPSKTQITIAQHLHEEAYKYNKTKYYRDYESKMNNYNSGLNKKPSEEMTYRLKPNSKSSQKLPFTISPGFPTSKQERLRIKPNRLALLNFNQNLATRNLDAPDTENIQELEYKETREKEFPGGIDLSLPMIYGELNGQPDYEALMPHEIASLKETRLMSRGKRQAVLKGKEIKLNVSNISTTSKSFSNIFTNSLIFSDRSIHANGNLNNETISKIENNTRFSLYPNRFSLDGKSLYGIAPSQPIEIPGKPLINKMSESLKNSSEVLQLSTIESLCNNTDLMVE